MSSFSNSCYSDLFDLPLNAYENLTFDDIESYFEQQSQKTGPLPSQNLPSIASSSSSWSSDASTSFLDPYSVTSSSSSSHSTPSSSFSTTLTEEDYAFLANLDPSLLGVDHDNDTQSTPLNGTGSKKRSRIDDKSEVHDNAPSDASTSRKRRRFSDVDSQNLPNLPAPTMHIPPPPYAPLPQDPANPDRASSFNGGINENSYTVGSCSNDTFSQSTPMSYPSVNVSNGPLDWIPGFIGQETFFDYAPFSSSNVNAVAPETFPSPTTQQLRLNAAVYNYNLTHTNALANNATHSGADYSQHSGTPFRISMAGHTGISSMINALGPSTSEALSVEPVSTNLNYSHPVSHSGHPFYPSCNAAWTTSATSATPQQQNVFYPSSQSNASAASSTHTLIPSTSAAKSTSHSSPLRSALVKRPLLYPSAQTRHDTKNATRQRQLLPSPELWTKLSPTRYACRYKGPANPEGCDSILSTTRNLGRHMREVHAQAELEMKLNDDQRMACNGLPDGLKWMPVVCPLDDGDLDKCQFYCNNGSRWAVQTMGRADKVLKEHVALDHDTDALPKAEPKARKKQKTKA